MGLHRTMVPASVVSWTGSCQVSAPSVDVRATIREVDQVAPCRVTLKSHTTPSGACQTTALPSGCLGRGVMILGVDHLVSPFRRRAPCTAESSEYSPEPP